MLYQNFVAALIICIATTGFAQDPFWSEDFSGGEIPADWSNVDDMLTLNGDGDTVNVLFTYCADVTACAPAVYSFGAGFGEFAAPTAGNGYVVVDSDAGGELDTFHLTRFTSPVINCADQPEVYLSFASHIATFANNAQDNAVLRVWTSGSQDWTTITLYPGLTTAPGTEASANPVSHFIDISDYP